jgi:DNA-binding transcriptional MerR regulator
MLKIGEFSSLSQVSIKTLRYYDELGLLRPVRTDPESGYRYYSASQLARLHRILALRELGFPLDRIGQALEEGISADALRGMLRLRRVEQEERVQEEGETLDRVNARLRLIEMEGVMGNEVVIKHIAPQWIASLREKIPAHRLIGGLIARLYGMLGPLASEGPGVALFHDTEFKEQDIDTEVGVYLKRATTSHEQLKVYQLPAATVASVIHHGAFDHIGEAYAALLRWVEMNNYRQAGPTRELFLHVSAPVTRQDPSNVTEIQVPVEKN